MFRPVSAELEFVAIEEAELARWKANNVFERSMTLREGAEPWVFYEGPPTANGQPGLHHVWARVYKDLFCRYQTMRGRYVARRARVGHPRPARRGRRSKSSWASRERRRSRSKIGIARVHAAVPRVGAHATSTSSSGSPSALATGSTSSTRTTRIHPTYVESVWWHLKQLFERGLLYEDLQGHSRTARAARRASRPTSSASPASTPTRPTRART